MPDGFEVSHLVGALADGWGLEVATIDYAAVGGGSYHWVVHDIDGTRRFVTVDDLGQKPWLGDSRDAVFVGLRRAFDTAGALHDLGLGFVVAPIRTDRGETVRRIGERHAVALFPFVDGHAGRFGHYEDAATRAAVLAMLADLHRATPAVTSSHARSVSKYPAVVTSRQGSANLTRRGRADRSPNGHGSSWPLMRPTWPNCSRSRIVSPPTSRGAGASGSSHTASRMPPT